MAMIQDIPSKRQPWLLRVSIRQQLTCITMAYLLASSLAWYGLIAPQLQQHRALQAESQRVQQQWQQAQTVIRQGSKQIASDQDLGQRVTSIALANRVLISDLTPIGSTQWQMAGISSIEHFEGFLHTLDQHPPAWAITSMQLQVNPDHNLQWHLTWQNTAPRLTGHTCHCSPQASLAHQFRARNTLDDEILRNTPLSNIEWLGVLQQADHSAALIRISDFPPRLIEPGDTVGQEHWQLTTIDRHQAQFIDAQQQPHSLTLPWPA